MSQNPAHAHRRALSPPAVTRFQLITPAAAEAVFAPPYVPDRSERLRYSSRRPAQPITYTQLPEPVVRQEPPPPPPTQTLELPPPVTTTPVARPREPERSSPGSWRDILARLDLGEPAGTSAPAEPEEIDAPAEPEEIDAPGEPVPWELEAFTAPGYTAPRTVEPQESERAPDHEPAIAPRAEEPIAEAQIEDTEDSFPLDAFIVPPEDVSYVSDDSDMLDTPGAAGGGEGELAAAIADRLEALASRLRTDGIAVLGGVESEDDLSRVLAAVVAGFVAREA